MAKSKASTKVAVIKGGKPDSMKKKAKPVKKTSLTAKQKEELNRRQEVKGTKRKAHGPKLKVSKSFKGVDIEKRSDLMPPTKV